LLSVLLGCVLLPFRLTLVATQAVQIQLVDARHDSIEFFAQALVGADVEVAAQQRVKGAVKILLGGVGVACLIVGEASLIFLFDADDQIGDSVSVWR